MDFDSLWAGMSPDSCGDVRNELDLLRGMLERIRWETHAASCFMAMLQDAQKAPQMASRSYLHPNGFVKVSLWLHPHSGTKLVAHIWPPGTPVGDIHNHRWCFGSLIVMGELDTAEFDSGDVGVGEKYAEYLYRSPGDDLAFVMDRVGSQWITEKRRTTWTRGSVNTLEYTVLHRAWNALREPAITIVLEGPVRQSSTTVLKPVRMPSQPDPRVSALTPREYRSWCDNLKDAFASLVAA